ncbi:hypothetical protein GCM10011351_00150 [Paraliobacillus quinghaiensis]|uniref:Uncharacterized protein n=1 Tax=Paraliobacillus quinghaiensis TaxID=470815 RepID=A0A917TF23_9BACI|nr:hypothetical protein GCM10011351_00150 [Paraliobacillus quinghaiensis]
MEFYVNIYMYIIGRLASKNREDGFAENFTGGIVNNRYFIYFLWGNHAKL